MQSSVTGDALRTEGAETPFTTPHTQFPPPPPPPFTLGWPLWAGGPNKESLPVWSNPLAPPPPPLAPNPKTGSGG